MENVRTFFGILIMILGVFAGVYIGGWVLFLDGLLDLIEIIQEWSIVQAEPTTIAWAAVRVLFLGELVGGLIAWVGIVIGVLVVESG